MTPDELRSLAGVVRRLVAAPVSDERDAELDLVEHELALLSPTEQEQVRRFAGF